MADTRNADLTFGATDYLVYMAAVNTAAPTPAFGDPATPWVNLGWVTTEGGLFKVEEESKDIDAAGSLEPIRTLMTKSTKSLQVTFLEGLNPLVRSLYDNVPVASLQPTDGIVSYSLPDKPSDLRYAFIFDTMDGDKRLRLYMPNGKVTERGDEQPQTEDVMPVQMTFKFYKGTSNSAVKRFIDYGDVDVSGFFPAP
ncbi:phage tail protein [Streptomyces scabiei]|uniref:phage tail tube protein n=1 Tax=Streptomyces scabiei TaxID=1930 RepID=UPI0029AD34AA|nr:phage tail protein [Streptomyces scabiei]MDX2575895.1 phage tail protein [Streptomyces scabiei]MDX2885632.1 phage tail protein [Streptomyces scabiei]MDX2997638.1 phage tail protein [Streptomyces scabiei]MDX3032941.1 phage tail protein [Streptomyces scabiei]MDX3051282.1 phage tail protein [Streptomyces scabiei]